MTQYGEYWLSSFTVAEPGIPDGNDPIIAAARKYVSVLLVPSDILHIGRMEIEASYRFDSLVFGHGSVDIPHQYPLIVGSRKNQIFLSGVPC